MLSTIQLRLIILLKNYIKVKQNNIKDKKIKKGQLLSV